MFESINRQFEEAKRSRADQDLILESVLEVDEVIPGSDDELEAQVDVDSVPDDVYKKIDAELEKIVSAPDYDDTEAEELYDEEDEEFTDAEIDAVITEACGAWLDDENLGHPMSPENLRPKISPCFRTAVRNLSKGGI